MESFKNIGGNIAGSTSAVAPRRLKPRHAVSIGVAGVLLAVLTGCGPMSHSSTPSPASDPFSASSSCDKKSQAYGDSIPFRQAYDGLGKYCQTAVNPNASALKKDASKYDMASLKVNGLTEVQAYAAQKTVVTFVGSQALDSEVLDNHVLGVDGLDSNAVQWWRLNSKAFDPTALSYYGGPGAIATSGVVVSAVGELPNLVRDGGARVNKTSIQVTNVVASKDKTDGKKIITVSIDFKASYKATTASTVEWYGDTPQLRSDSPELFAPNAGKVVRNIILTGTFAYEINPMNQKIVSNSYRYKNTYKSTPGF